MPKATPMTSTRLPLPLVVVALLALAGCSNAANPAQQEVNQIVEGLKSAHPPQICDNGDSGHSLDNDEPWYDDYIEVDLTPDPLEAIKSSAQRQGFPLEDDTQFINDLKGIARPDGSHDTPYGEEKFNSTSSYLIATRDGTRLQVTVTRSGSVKLFCRDVKPYGKQMSTSAGRTIVRLSISMPPV
jgi:hypothetical protein